MYTITIIVKASTTFPLIGSLFLKRKIMIKFRRICRKNWKIWPKSKIVESSKVVLRGILQGFQVGSNKISK